MGGAFPALAWRVGPLRLTVVTSPTTPPHSMPTDRTQQQTGDERRRSEELSRRPATPPGQVPGYSLQQFLGSGSFGEVWSATDLKTGRRVAVKFYTHRSQSGLRELALEVEKLAVLASDRYVVQLLDVGWDADPPFYVMDYVDSGSLDDRLSRGHTLAVHEAVELFREIGIGMMHLHGKGILHCDLKPGNILLDQDGRPRVADFGQSRLHSDQTPSLGTLFYMAPEQADLQSAPDARWDVYALGAMLYTMLTGRPPHYDEKLVAQIESAGDLETRLQLYQEAIRNAPLPTDHRQRRGVDRELAQIVDRCLEPRPAARFGSVQSVLAALQMRDARRARRPLIMLGILGPLLLMMVISLFGYRAYQRVVEDTDRAVTNRAVESNLYAARYAARSVSERMGDYFRAVELLSRSTALHEALAEVFADPELAELREELSDPNRNDELAAIRQRFVENSLRKGTLQKVLEEHPQNPNHLFPLAASWFVNDRAGTQLASVYSESTTDPRNTIGKNYSYRSYFTGLNRDLIETGPDGTVRRTVSENPSERQVIEGPHLSAVFLSEGSDTFKFAFSAPVEVEGEIVGIVAITVELGGFVDFPDSPTRYAMLVDGRDGENQGVVLEHPLFDQLVETGQRIPASLVRTSIDLESLDRSERFHDPIGRDPAGAAYRSECVVAQAEVVRAPTGIEVGQREAPKTGLLVLAVEDYQSVIEPTHVLGRQLSQLAILAAVAFLAVAAATWAGVTRSLAGKSSGAGGFAANITERVDRQDAATVAAEGTEPTP